MVDRITPVKGKLVDLLYNTFTSYYRSGYIDVDGCVMPENYRNVADDIENFQVRDDDIWVCSFPKTGTTWTQEMVWCIVNDLDFERGKASLLERFPCLEISHMFEMPEIMRRNSGTEYAHDIYKNSVNFVDEMPVPRFIKSHLPINLLPRQLRTREKNPKIIYVVRNPKDTCISFYHYCQLVEGFSGSFEDFCNLFISGTMYYGLFWNHVLGFWNKRELHNILLLKYEDMQKDLPSVIKQTAEFLGKNMTNDQVSLLSEHLSFSNMKNNPAVNYKELISQIHKMLQVERPGEFMRKGTTEQWKTVMTPELIKRFDDWTDRHLTGTELSL